MRSAWYISYLTENGIRNSLFSCPSPFSRAQWAWEMKLRSAWYISYVSKNTTTTPPWWWPYNGPTMVMNPTISRWVACMTTVLTLRNDLLHATIKNKGVCTFDHLIPFLVPATPFLVPAGMRNGINRKCLVRSKSDGANGLDSSTSTFCRHQWLYGSVGKKLLCFRWSRRTRTFSSLRMMNWEAQALNWRQQGTSKRIGGRCIHLRSFSLVDDG